MNKVLPLLSVLCVLVSCNVSAQEFYLEKIQCEKAEDCDINKKFEAFLKDARAASSENHTLYVGTKVKLDALSGEINIDFPLKIVGSGKSQSEILFSNPVVVKHSLDVSMIRFRSHSEHVLTLDGATRLRINDASITKNGGACIKVKSDSNTAFEIDASESDFMGCRYIVHTDELNNNFDGSTITFSQLGADIRGDLSSRAAIVINSGSDAGTGEPRVKMTLQDSHFYRSECGSCTSDQFTYVYSKGHNNITIEDSYFENYSSSVSLKAENPNNVKFNNNLLTGGAGDDNPRVDITGLKGRAEVINNTISSANKELTIYPLGAIKESKPTAKIVTSGNAFYVKNKDEFKFYEQARGLQSSLYYVTFQQFTKALFTGATDSFEGIPVFPDNKAMVINIDGSSAVDECRVYNEYNEPLAVVNVNDGKAMVELKLGVAERMQTVMTRCFSHGVPMVVQEGSIYNFYVWKNTPEVKICWFKQSNLTINSSPSNWVCDTQAPQYSDIIFKSDIKYAKQCERIISSDKSERATIANEEKIVTLYNAISTNRACHGIKGSSGTAQVVKSVASIAIEPPPSIKVKLMSYNRTLSGLPLYTTNSLNIGLEASGVQSCDVIDSSGTIVHRLTESELRNTSATIRLGGPIQNVQTLSLRCKDSNGANVTTSYNNSDRLRFYHWASTPRVKTCWFKDGNGSRYSNSNNWNCDTSAPWGSKVYFKSHIEFATQCYRTKSNGQKVYVTPSGAYNMNEEVSLTLTNTVATNRTCIGATGSSVTSYATIRLN
ncbi:hypothetical protein [Pseudoalteromonas byunsanensis]|uniref:Ig-like domain-containing protein n=1 Tax=Pseudoalteromonas byunsanensis TaxID=327939 RepID=A0A1S1MX64_9GAMM|nr:hypothetical protein [Pseudoalteromonas byunsanensis]OHU93387.1 hypothetical protein BIW53_18670 [Pseudoalteromonas byunsanensis]